GKPQYTRLGRLVMLIFDPAAMNLPPTTDRNMFPPVNAIDWQGSPERPGPWLGLSEDHQDLLLFSDSGHWRGAVRHPPDIRDTRGLSPGGPVDCEQRYRDRSCEVLRNSSFLIIEPVAEIVFKPWRVPSWAKIRAGIDHYDRKMSFLIDPSSGEGHLVGGGFTIGAAF
ncbi:MAG TPA: hypothetical protein VGZ23_20645, partial [bacterium]|nr:hypothetical protein [bacterium]